MIKSLTDAHESLLEALAASPQEKERAYIMTAIELIEMLLQRHGVFVGSVRETTTPLLPYQQRVVTEKKELDERLSNLTAFTFTGVFKTLSAEERDRLNRQEDAMRKYSSVLGERIAAFTTIS